MADPSTVTVSLADWQAIRDQLKELEERIQKDNGAPLRLKEPDLFYGNNPRENVDQWLFEVEQYLLATGKKHASNRVAIAGSLLRGPAAVWWKRTVQDATAAGTPEETCTWEEFKKLINDAFRPINYKERARDKLANLRQRTSVSDYAAAFTTVSFDIPDLSDAEKKDRFFRGLKPDIAREVVLRGEPETFSDLVKLAERIDSLFFRQAQVSKKPFAARQFTVSSDNMRSGNAANGFQRGANGPAPMELGSIVRAPAPGAPPSGDGVNRYTKLTPELRQQLIREGKCLYCRQPGHVAVNCPKKNPNARRQ